MSNGVRNSKKGRNGLFILLLVLSSIALFSLLAVDLFDFAMLFILIVVSIAWLITMVFGSIFTLFMCWSNDGWKSFADGFTNMVGDMWGGSDGAYSVIKNSFSPVAIVTGVLCGLLLLFGILSFVLTKDEKKPIGKLIVGIIFTILFIILLIFGIKFYFA